MIPATFSLRFTSFATRPVRCALANAFHTRDANPARFAALVAGQTLIRNAIDSCPHAKAIRACALVSILRHARAAKRTVLHADLMGSGWGFLSFNEDGSITGKSGVGLEWSMATR